MIFSSHPRFTRDLKSFLDKHHQNESWLSNLQNLLTAHFEKKTVHLSTDVVAQIGKHRDFEIWKVYMAVGGVRKNQRPRVCFSKVGLEAIFLCSGTHIDNYTTAELFAKGKARLLEMVGN